MTGLIDWAGARRGPVLYDVASAVMYLGGPQDASTFLTTYAARGPLREAVQGVYFAGRIAANDLTGIADRSENAHGLDDAHRRLSELG